MSLRWCVTLSFLTSDNPVVCFDPTVPEARVAPYQVRPPTALDWDGRDPIRMSWPRG
jgi:hypothetical protein